MLQLHKNHLLRALVLGGSVGAWLVGCSGDVGPTGSSHNSSTGTTSGGAGGSASGSGVTSGTSSTSGTSATSGTSSTGNTSGTTSATGGTSSTTGASTGSSGGAGGQGGSAQAGSGPTSSGAGGAGTAGSGGAGGNGGARDAGVGDSGPVSGCQGALVGPPDYSHDSAGMSVAGADANQMAALVRANHWRTPGGLVPFNANAMLQQAAVAHAHFMTINPAACYPGAHQEVMSAGGTTCMGFTGMQPWDRMTAAGYQWRTAAEVIDSAADGTTAVDEWIWTVYHREPFLDAQYLEVGFGLDNKNAVMDFSARAAGSTTKQIVFPLPGQTGVKIDFNGAQEGPTPKPPATKGWPSGTVISVTFSGKYTIVSHALYDASCQPVTHTAHGMFDGDMNAGDNFFYMFADSPLAHGTTYTAQVSAMVGGTPWSETWAFTTQ